MDLFRSIIDLFLHLDDHLSQVISQYGVWTNLILFLIVFAETGPGGHARSCPAIRCCSRRAPSRRWARSTPGAARACSDRRGDRRRHGELLGRRAGSGPRAFSGEVRWLRKEYLDRTHAFYEKHGGKTIILARFVPIIRTFAPFVAGVGAMNYGEFLLYNVVGAVLWVGLFVLGGILLRQHSGGAGELHHRHPGDHRDLGHADRVRALRARRGEPA